MENKAHRTYVFDPQLQTDFKLHISEETVQFKNCEHSKDLDYCKLHEDIYEQDTLIVYVANFNTNKVFWHASILCDFK